STSDGARPFWSKEKGSNERQSPIAACCTVGRPHNIKNQTSQRLSYFKPLPVPKTLTTDSPKTSLVAIRGMGYFHYIFDTHDWNSRVWRNRASYTKRDCQRNC